MADPSNADPVLEVETLAREIAVELREVRDMVRQYREPIGRDALCLARYLHRYVVPAAADQQAHNVARALASMAGRDIVDEVEALHPS